MLRNTVTSDRILWSAESVKNSQLDNLSLGKDVEPSMILISTSGKKNLARIRGACKSVRKLFPDTEMLVCCWSLESETDANRPRLKDAGASIVCTTFLQARQLIDAAALVERRAGVLVHAAH